MSLAGEYGQAGPGGPKASDDAFRVENNAALADIQKHELGQDLGSAPLWLVPARSSLVWEKVGEWLHEQEADWSFWVRWYEKALSGEQQDSELLTEIALLPNEDWEKGAHYVNALIVAKLTRRAVELTPYGEEIVVTEEGRFAARPLPLGPPATISSVCDAVSYAAERIGARTRDGHTNLYMLIRDELAAAREAVRRYSDHPVRLHDELGSIWRSLSRRMQEDLPRGDMLLDAFERALDNAQIDLRREYPEVARAHRSRTSVRLRRTEGRDRDLMDAVAPAAAALSTEPLAKEMLSDAGRNMVAADPETRETAEYRFTSRLARMLVSGRGAAVSVAEDARKLDQGAEAAASLAERGGAAWQTLVEKGSELLNSIW